MFFNFLSIGAVILTAFCLFSGAFFLIVKKKSASTLYLGLVLMLLALFAGAYIPAQIFYHPLVAMHRWVTVPAVLLSLAFITRFFFSFEDDGLKKQANLVLIGQGVGALLVTGLFVFKTYNAGKIYNFDGHYYDFNAEGISGVVAKVIYGYIAVFIGVAVYKWRTISPQHRTSLLALLGCFAIAAAIPAVSNDLSRVGEVSRGFFQTIMVISLVVGLSAIFIFYINTTSDKTTFMAKILGITLVTFLLVMQMVSYLSLNESEAAYNSIQVAKAAPVVESSYYKNSPDLEYVAKIHQEEFDQSIKMVRPPENEVDFEVYQPEFYNAALLKDISAFSAHGFADKLKAALERTENYFTGYRVALEEFLKSNRQLGGDDLRAETLAYLDELSSDNIVHANKLRQLPDEEFATHLKEYIEVRGGSTSFAPFKERLLNEIEGETLTDRSLKREVLKFIAPVRAVGSRLYRQSDDSKTHYVSYMYYNLSGSVLYEIGFSYQAYRAYIHKQARTFTGTLLLITLLVLVIFPLFFRGSLVKPLEEVIAAVQQVNDGNLNTVIPMHVNDEIGFLANSFNDMVVSVKDARENLEDKVEERTRELQQTLKDVRALKEQQDGDYFLTNLLIEPLSVTGASTSRVSIESFIEQKKKFSFRKWSKDIGGDINIAHNIKLRDRPFTVFLNADAMGKSIQGAGGALVLGSVFHSIIQRTSSGSATRNFFPERWLKNTMNEINDVFVSFDGSMLISMVLGLIDEASGLLYHVNAEHPWPILLRDGKASFLTDDFSVRKLGVPGTVEFIVVETFQLEAGDAILLGSDGRDDIAIGKTEDGKRVINEDDKQILAFVEESKGDLSNVRDQLAAWGDLTDDLSLLKVTYKGARPGKSPGKTYIQSLGKARALLKEKRLEDALALLADGQRQNPDEPTQYHYLTRIYDGMGEHQNAAYSALRYIELAPGNTSFLYPASLCLRKAGRLSEAIDISERLRLREPEHVRNLVHLATLYLKVPKLKRAEQMVNLALEIEPANQKAREIKTRIEEQLQKLS